jgi:hypothetical protein
MIRYRLRLPLVGDQVHALRGCAKTKTKTFLRRENQDQLEGSARLPLVGPKRSKNQQKGDPTPAHLLAGFQAHPSMRICLSPGQNSDGTPALLRYRARGWISGIVSRRPRR